jgi:hypothetical protein
MTLRLTIADDEAVRVCMRVRDAVDVVPRSIVAMCDECHEDIWVDPFQKVPMPEKYRLCLQCCALHVAANDMRLT